MNQAQRVAALKIGWHLGLAVLAFFEMTRSKTPLRRAFTGGCAGWHIGAAYDDWKSSTTANDYSEET
jgi:hypothetical protein